MLISVHSVTSRQTPNARSSKPQLPLHILKVDFEDLRNVHEFVILLGLSEMTWGEPLSRGEDH